MDGEPGSGPGLVGLWYEEAQDTRYSYIFNGESQALDHVYVTNLAIGSRPWSRDLVVPHVQADFAAHKRTSDHDPLRVLFWVKEEAERRLFLPLAVRTEPPPPPANPLTIQTLSYSGRDEYVTIRNDGTSAQNMTGWRLVSVVGTQTYYFPGGYVLEAGATVRVHTGPDAWGNGASDLKWTAAYIWNNDGDKAELLNAAGTVVSSKCYAAGCP